MIDFLEANLKTEGKYNWENKTEKRNMLERVHVNKNVS